MNKPITSRIKRSPLFVQANMAIDPDNPSVVTASGTIKGEPTTVTKEVTKTGKLTGKKDKKQMSDEAWKNYLKNETPEQKRKRLKREVEAGLREPDTKTTETTIKPGEDKKWEETLKVKTTGDVMQPWEARRMSRAIKKEQRDIRRAKIKAAKKAGTLTPKTRKKFKAEEAEAELAEFKAAAARNKAARASGKRTGTSGVRTGERDMTLSDLGGRENQEAYLTKRNEGESKNNNTEKNKEKKKAAKKQNITTPKSSQASKAINPEAEKKKSAAGMNPSAFKMYGKSPATKKLKGAQNTLPQHLQDAIKAAPGKMRGPLKKGYFKKY